MQSSTRKKRQRRPERASTSQQPDGSRRTRRWLSLVSVLVLLAGSACNGKSARIDAIPLPPLTSEAAMEEELLLVPPMFVWLPLYLDEVERYFEGIECAKLADDPEDCVFE